MCGNKNSEKSLGGPWNGAQCLCFLSGKSEEDGNTSNTASIFRWLVAYELTDTLLLIDPRGAGKITFLLSQSKEQTLRSQLLPPPANLDLGGRSPVELELLLKPKADDRSAIDRIVSRLKGHRVGGCWNAEDEPHSTSFCESVLGAIREEEGAIQLVESWEGVSRVLIVKDTKEINGVRSACSITDVVFKKFVIPKLEESVDAGKKVNPEKLGEYIQGYFLDPQKISNKLQTSAVESCYPPIFSSAARLPLNLADFEHKSKVLDFSTIVCAVGARYRSMCSNAMRTILINPSEDVTAAYKALEAAYQAALKSIVEGAPASAPYKAARRALQERDAELAEHLEASVGHSLGIQFFERQQLTPDAEETFQAGWVLNLQVVLQDVRGHAMGLADTVVVVSGGAPAEQITKFTKEGLSYDLEDNAAGGGDDDGGGDALKDEDEGEEEVTGKRKSRMRDQTKTAASEKELKEMQRQGLARLQEEIRQRFEEDATIGGVAAGEVEKDWLTLNSYPKGAGGFPNEATPHRLTVDQENDTLLVPINGFVVPIHISLIKSVTKLDDTIRFQLRVPGKGKQSGAANRVAKEFPNVVWIKEVVYQLKNASILASIDRSIKEMKKRVTAQEKRKADLSGLAEQDPLVLAREKGPFLHSVFVRPNLAGKRVLGSLEAHKNGMRYTTNKGQKLDILYSNVAHAIFQPAEQEAQVILHLALRIPVVVGKRKTTDVQFVQETMEASSRLDARRRNYGDADEIEEEAREKQAAKKINRTFFKFCKDIEDFAKKNDPDGDEVIKFEFPSRKLGFWGVPYKSNVLLQPTTDGCLVHLVEGPPFFVLALQDVEVASFERVSFELKHFDLVFVLKDYNKDPISISAIPSQDLENVQEWLREWNVTFFVNPKNYNWKEIMTEIRSKTLKEFLDQGGWDFMDAEPDSDDPQGGDDDDDEEDEFNPKEIEGSSSEESDFDDDDVVDEDEDDDDEEGSGSGSEEEEADWDDLEREAAESDKKKWAAEVKGVSRGAPDLGNKKQQQQQPDVKKRPRK